MVTISFRKFTSLVYLTAFALLAALFLAGCGGGSSGVGADYQGRVVDAQTAQGIPNVAVTLLDTGDSGHTDENGYFSFSSSTGLTNPSILVEGPNFSAQASLGQNVPSAAQSVEFTVAVISEDEVTIANVSVNLGESSSPANTQQLPQQPQNTPKASSATGPSQQNPTSNNPVPPATTAKPTATSTPIPPPSTQSFTFNLTINVFNDAGSRDISQVAGAELAAIAVGDVAPLFSVPIPTGVRIVNTEVTINRIPQNRALTLVLIVPGSGKVYSSNNAILGSFVEATVTVNQNRPIGVSSDAQPGTINDSPTQGINPAEMPSPKVTPEETRPPTSTETPRPNSNPPGLGTPDPLSPSLGGAGSTGNPAITPTASPTRTPTSSAGGGTPKPGR